MAPQILAARAEAIAACAGSARRTRFFTAPAVSKSSIDFSCGCRSRNRPHCASATGCEYTRSMLSTRAPSRPTSACAMRNVTSPVTRRSNWRISSATPGTAPAMPFSTGTTPNFARPLATASKTSFSVRHGSNVVVSPTNAQAASSLNAPGAPWYAASHTPGR